LAVIVVEIVQSDGVFQVRDSQLAAGLTKTKWEGRFKEISKEPQVILDGAHNPEGVKSLVGTIKTHLGDKKVPLIFSGLADKKLHVMIAQLEEVAHTLTFTSFEFPRAAKTSELYENS